MKTFSRRDLLKSSALVSLPIYTNFHFDKNSYQENKDYEYSLNMSTIMGQNIGFINEIKVAAQAGYTSCEIWVPTLQKYLNSGGSIAEAKSLINDTGIKIQNAIGFAQWIVDDPNIRSKALDQIKQEMEWLQELGCPRTAAPPMGATTIPKMDLDKIAERYNTILEIGQTMGVNPILELWGHSTNLNKVQEVLYVASASGNPNAKLLLDIFHIYKGESSFESLHIVGNDAIEVFHMNDYTTNINPKTIKDADRIYAGDGEAPIAHVLKVLKPKIISLELFNRDLYKLDPLLVASTGLTKMKEIVSKMG